MFMLCSIQAENADGLKIIAKVGLPPDLGYTMGKERNGEHPCWLCSGGCSGFVLLRRGSPEREDEIPDMRDK
jgi:hypothetical protein